MTFSTFLIILLIAVCITLACYYYEEHCKRKEAEFEQERWLNRARRLDDDVCDLVKKLVDVQTGERRKTVKLILLQSDLKELQDKYSAVICPRNDHVWVDGRCKKCGRLQTDA